MKIFISVAVITVLMSILSGCVNVPADGTTKTVPEEVKASRELSDELNSYKGEYAKLDYKNTESLMKSILDSDIDVIRKVMNNPDKYEPPVLMAYAEQLFSAGQFETAMFWYYTAQLRARSDANKSLDLTVHDGVTNLSIRFGSRIGEYAKQNPDLLEKVMARVVDWDKNSKREYNPEWVAVLGQESKISDKIRFRPESDFNLINAETRRGWELGFKAAMPLIKSNYEEEHSTNNQ